MVKAMISGGEREIGKMAVLTEPVFLDLMPGPFWTPMLSGGKAWVIGAPPL